MSLTLGLDVGTSSIGWAVVDEDAEQIIDCGVRIFHEGVNVQKDGKELSKNAERRKFRQTRRQYRRRKLRINMMVKLLEELEMIPDIDNRQEWFKLNPYYLRWYGLDNELSKEEFGRILFQFSKRRGFKSSRKGDAKETKIDVTDKETGKIGINDNQKKLDEGFRTLGEYFYAIFHLDNEPYEFKERIRNRVITRQNYIDEFELLWAMQKEYNPNFYRDELKFKIGDPKKGILFFQRELLSQKKTIGKCTFEKNKPRCPISRVEFEEFRTWQLLNNLRLDYEPISAEMKVEFYNYVANKATDTKMSDLHKKFKKKFELGNQKFNYDDDTRIRAHYTSYQFNNIIKKFPKDRLKYINIEQLKYEMWDVLYFAKNDEWLHNHAQNRWDFSTEQADMLCKINLKDGFSKLSIKAIKNILPHLQNGRLYYDAVILGGVDNALAELKNELAPEEIHKTYNFIDEKLNKYQQDELKTKDTLFEEIKKHLKENYNLSDKNLKKLYHPSEIEIKKSEDKLLKIPDNLRNPIVQKGLSELRKIVNALQEKYKKHGGFSRINIELARELKKKREEREEIRKQNIINEKKNTKAKEYLEQNGLALNRKNIQKKILFDEMKKRYGTVISPYSHKPISLSQLFSRDNIIEVDHMIPYRRSLDDSFNNKTLCFRQENQDKLNKTPYEYLCTGKDNKEANDHWEACKSVAWKIFDKSKARRFCSEQPFDLEAFAHKQLTDTQYFAKYAAKYLQTICSHVETYVGSITSRLRHDWGLNSILVKNLETKTAKDKDRKNRDDHRHHVIDAIVIAVTNDKIKFRISNTEELKEELKYVNRDIIKQPWNVFRNDVEIAVSHILVSFENRIQVTTKIVTHKKKKDKVYKTEGYAVRGKLHEDNFYGKKLSPIDNKYYYNKRIPIKEIDNSAKVAKIADPAIKQIVLDRLKELNVDLSKEKYTVPNNAFTRSNPITGLKESILFLNNKRGEPIPINKIRLKNNLGNTSQLHEDINVHVDPDNNYIVAIYEDEKGIYSKLILTFLEAVNRRRNKIEIVPPYLGGAKLKFTMKKNEMFLLGTNFAPCEVHMLDKQYIFYNLYRVEKFSDDLTFRKHIASTLKDHSERVIITSMKTLKESNPIKVRIDVLGNIIKRRE